VLVAPGCSVSSASLVVDSDTAVSFRLRSEPQPSFFLRPGEGRRAVWTGQVSRFELARVSPCRVIFSGRLSVAGSAVGCGEDFGHGGGGAREGCLAGGVCSAGGVGLSWPGVVVPGGVGVRGGWLGGRLPAWGGVRVTVVVVCGGGGLGVVLGGGWLCWRGFWGCGCGFAVWGGGV
jgi:hypothetical protein